MEKIVLTLKNFKGHQVVVTNKDADMLELQDMTWAQQWTWFVKMEKSFNKSDDWTATLEIV